MADQTLRVMCPNLVCRKILAVPASARGKTVKCKGCGTSIRIPEKEKGPPPEAAPKAPSSSPTPA